MSRFKFSEALRRHVDSVVEGGSDADVPMPIEEYAAETGYDLEAVPDTLQPLARKLLAEQYKQEEQEAEQAAYEAERREQMLKQQKTERPLSELTGDTKDDSIRRSISGGLAGLAAMSRATRGMPRRRTHQEMGRDELYRALDGYAGEILEQTNRALMAVAKGASDQMTSGASAFAAVTEAVMPGSQLSTDALNMATILSNAKDEMDRHIGWSSPIKPGTDTFDPDNITQVIGESIGQLGVQILAGGGTGMALKNAPKLVQSFAAMSVFAGTAAAPVTGTTYLQAYAETGDQNKAAWEGLVAGGITMLLENVSVAKVMRKTPLGKKIFAEASEELAGTVLKRVGKGSAEGFFRESGTELGEEALQSMLRSMMRYGMTAEEAAVALVSEGAWKELVLAAGAGGFVGAGAGGLLSAHSPRTEPKGKATPTTTPVAKAQKTRDSYYDGRSIIKPEGEQPYVKVDQTTASRIADAYDDAKHSPNDPEVKESYDAMATETVDQYRHITGRGTKFEFTTEDPYTSSQELVEDIEDRDAMRVFLTDVSEMPADHPLAKKTGIVVKNEATGEDVDLTVNDVFRAVHDYFGHAAGGYQFGPRGEENAWLAHSRMYSPLARGAMTAETRGQNSWVNSGRHLRRPDGTLPVKGDKDFVAPADRPFAEQKAFLLPSWALETNQVPRTPAGSRSSLRDPEIAAFVEQRRQQEEAANEASIKAQEVRAQVADEGRVQAEGQAPRKAQRQARPVADAVKELRARAAKDAAKLGQDAPAMPEVPATTPLQREAAQFAQGRGYQLRLVSGSVHSPAVVAGRQIAVDATAGPGDVLFGLVAHELQHGLEEQSKAAAARVAEGDARPSDTETVAAWENLRDSLDQIAPERMAAARAAYGGRAKSLQGRKLGDDSLVGEGVGEVSEDVAPMLRMGLTSEGRQQLVTWATSNPGMAQRILVQIKKVLSNFGIGLPPVDPMLRKEDATIALKLLEAFDVMRRVAEGDMSDVTTRMAVARKPKKKAKKEIERRRVLVESVGPLMTPDEKAYIDNAQARMVDKFVDSLEGLPDIETMSNIALSGVAMRGWYQRSARTISSLFGPDGPRFAALLAALSPQKPVDRNMLEALNVWVDWETQGRPQSPETIEQIIRNRIVDDPEIRETARIVTWTNNGIRALTADDADLVADAADRMNLSGPKVNSFWLNLMGNVVEVTNEAWMMTYSLMPKTELSRREGGIATKGAPYIAMSVRARQTAEALTKSTGETWTPAEVQETVWSWAKLAGDLTDRTNKPRAASVRDLIDQGLFTPETIAEAGEDFASMIVTRDNIREIIEGVPEYARILREVVDPQAAQGRAETAARARAEGGRFGGDPNVVARYIQKFDQFRGNINLDEVAESWGIDDAPRFAVARTHGPAFQRWFGDSKVVDDAGQPLVVYHGTKKAGFTQFDDGTRARPGGGIYFARDKSTADTYASRRGLVSLPVAESVEDVYSSPAYEAMYYRSEDLGGFGVRPIMTDEGHAAKTLEEAKAGLARDAGVDVAEIADDEVAAMHHLYDLETGELVSETDNEADLLHDYNADVGRYEEHDGAVYASYLSIQDPLVVDAEGRNWDDLGEYSDTNSITREARDADYDGVIIENVTDEGPNGQGYEGPTTVYIVFKPEQIKSAEYNVGTFDPQNPDIRFAAANKEGVREHVKAVAEKAKRGSLFRQSFGPTTAQDARVLLGFRGQLNPDQEEQSLAVLEAVARRLRWTPVETESALGGYYRWETMLHQRAASVAFARPDMKADALAELRKRLATGPTLSDVSNVSAANAAMVTLELVPNPKFGVLQRLENAPYAVRERYTAESLRAISDDDGSDLLMRIAGLQPISTERGPGFYMGVSNPGVQTTILVNPSAPETHWRSMTRSDIRDRIRDYARSINTLFHQDSVAWHRPYAAASRDRANASSVTLGRTATDVDLRAMYDAVIDVAGPIIEARAKEAGGRLSEVESATELANNLAFVPDPTGMRVLNVFGDYDTGWDAIGTAAGRVEELERLRPFISNDEGYERSLDAASLRHQEAVDRQKYVDNETFLQIIEAAADRVWGDRPEVEVEAYRVESELVFDRGLTDEESRVAEAGPAFAGQTVADVALAVQAVNDRFSAEGHGDPGDVRTDASRARFAVRFPERGGTYYHVSGADRSSTGLDRRYAGTGNAGAERRFLNIEADGLAEADTAMVHLYAPGVRVEAPLVGPASVVHTIQLPNDWRVLSLDNEEKVAELRDRMDEMGVSGPPGVRLAAADLGYAAFGDPDYGFLQVVRDIPPGLIQSAVPMGDLAREYGPEGSLKLGGRRSRESVREDNDARFAMARQYNIETGFATRSLEALQKSAGGKASPEQLARTLSNAGVSADEMQWLGISDAIEKYTDDKGLVDISKVIADIELAIAIYYEEQEYPTLPDEPQNWTQAADGESLVSDWGYTVTPRTGDEGVMLHAAGGPIDNYPTAEEAQQAADRLGPVMDKGHTHSNFGTHESYTLPGGSHYREVLLRVHPHGAGPETFTHQHFPDSDVTAFLRTKFRRSLSGEAVLFLEELQSDWHQEGNKRDRDTGERLGYRDLLGLKMLDRIESHVNQTPGWAREIVQDNVYRMWGVLGRRAVIERARDYADAVLLLAKRSMPADQRFNEEATGAELRSATGLLSAEWGERDDSSDWPTKEWVDHIAPFAKKIEDAVRGIVRQRTGVDVTLGLADHKPPLNAAATFGREIGLDQEAADALYEWKVIKGRASTDLQGLRKLSDGRPISGPYSQTWHELGLRRAVMMAVEAGQEAIQWPTGAVMMQRYHGTDNTADILQYKRDGDDWVIRVRRNRNPWMPDENVKDGALESRLGDRVAREVRSGLGEQLAESDGWTKLTGVSVPLEGSGMVVQYDKKMVAYARKLAKRYKSKVTLETQSFVPMGDQRVGYVASDPSRKLVDAAAIAVYDAADLVTADVTPGSHWSVVAGNNKYTNIVATDRRSRRGLFETKQEAEAFAAEMRASEPGVSWRVESPLTGLESAEVWTLAITPEMVRAVENADLPRFAVDRNLANPAKGPQSRALVNAIDNANEVDVLEDDRVFAEAERRLSADREGERRSILNTIDSGFPLNEVETVIAKKLADRTALNAVRKNSEEGYYEAIRMTHAYRMSGTIWARAGRLRRDDVQSPDERFMAYIASSLAAPSEQLRGKLSRLYAALGRQHRSGNNREALKTQKTIDEVLRQQARFALKVKDNLHAVGINPAAITPDYAGNPQVLSNIGRAIQSSTSSLFDMALEYWRNGLLSLPTTHAANILSNKMWIAYTNIAQRTVEAFINTAIGNKAVDAPTLGELPHVWAALMPGIKRGAANAIRAFSTETPVLRSQIEAQGTATTGPGQKMELTDSRAAIPGKTGRVIRVAADRSLLAEDEFFRGIAAEMEAAAAAYRIAKMEGLSGVALERRMVSLTNDLGSEAWAQALAESDRMLFQAELGDVGKSFLKFRQSFPVSSFIMPFVTTPVNLLKEASGLVAPWVTPYTLYKATRVGMVKVGLAQGTYEVTATEATRLAAKNLLAWGIMLVILGLMDDEDGVPRITGSPPKNPAARNAAYRTAPPMSIRVGEDNWVSYARFDPFATVLGVTVDFLRDVKDEDKSTPDALVSTIQNLTAQLEDKTFLSGIADFQEAFLKSDVGYSNRAVNYLSKFSASWVPNLVRGTLRSTDDSFRNTYVRVEDDTEGVDGLIGPALRITGRSALPRVLGDEPPKYDWLGRSIDARNIIPGRRWGTDLAYRIFVPARLNDTSDMHQLDRLLVNYNNNPDEIEGEWWPGRPSYRLSDRQGGTTVLSPAEYAEYSRRSGELLQQRLRYVQFDVESPSIEEVKKIRSELTKSRRRAGDEVIRARMRDER